MLRIFSILFLVSTVFCSSYAQVTSDALLFTERIHPNSARAAAVGGALGALGGDITSLNNNPAGLGIYRSSEFTLSPGMQFTNIRSTFVSDSTLPINNNSRVSFNFGGIGMVLAQELTEDWRQVNFGISYGRIASFNRTFSFNGLSTGSRIINFTEEANASNALPDNLDPLEERLAWDAYMIDNPLGGTDYVGAVVDSNLSYIQKSQYVRQSGGINELAISMAGNYLHKFYIGGTLGIDFLRLRDIRTYNETELTGNMDFKDLTFDEDREVKGTGVNFKFGFIYRATKKLRLGMSVHSPTIYSLTETLNNSLSGSVIWGDTLRTVADDNPLLSPTAQYKHNFITPWQVSASIGQLFGSKESKTKGFLGVDAEYLNYSRANFALKALDVNVTPADQIYINNVNEGINNLYRSVLRVRVGGELALSSLRLRGGYRLQTSPYKTSVQGVSDLRHDISFGLGIRQEFFFFDISYVNTLMDFEYAPYYATSENNNPRTINDMNSGLFLLTFGLRF
jgi:hypothetical protein